MPWYYRLAGVALVVLALLGQCAYIVHLRAERTEAVQAARSAQAALSRTQATLARREVQRAASAREAASARASLAEATNKNQAWANSPVPQEVQDALCAHLDCAAGPNRLRDIPAGSGP